MEDYECPYCGADNKDQFAWWELCETGSGETEATCSECGKTFEFVWETALDTFTRTLEKRDMQRKEAQRMVEASLSKAKLKEE